MQRILRTGAAAAAAIVLLAAPAATAAEDDATPRTASGRPDFTANYDVATLTPLNRPAEFGANLFLAPEQANEIVERERQRVASRAAKRRITEPPPPGGAPPIGLGDEFRETSGAGNVGGYNNFWTDRGSDVFSIDGKSGQGPPVRFHGRGPHGLDRALERRVPVAGNGNQGLRIRLPRRQLRHGRHPRGGAPAGRREEDRRLRRRVGRRYRPGGSVASRPSRGAPVPDEPMNSLRPSGKVRSRPFALFEPSFA